MKTDLDIFSRQNLVKKQKQQNHHKTEQKDQRLEGVEGAENPLLPEPRAIVLCPQAPRPLVAEEGAVEEEAEEQG